MSPEIFSEAYIDLWKIERDKGAAQLESDELNTCLSLYFAWRICIVSMRQEKVTSWTVRSC
ncbi:colicin immunity domain-containing protein [Pseudomonas poae]|nr:colicin immunity domain-containing protein [Pseudomonas poae]